MKKLLILSLLIMAGMSSVKAQSKYPNHLDTIMTYLTVTGILRSSSLFLATDGTLKPMGAVVFGRTGELLRIDNPKNGWNNKIDSIIIHVKKQKLRWINDSTAVITK